MGLLSPFYGIYTWYKHHTYIMRYKHQTPGILWVVSWMFTPQRWSCLDASHHLGADIVGSCNWVHGLFRGSFIIYFWMGDRTNMHQWFFNLWSEIGLWVFNGDIIGIEIQGIFHNPSLTHRCAPRGRDCIVVTVSLHIIIFPIRLWLYIITTLSLSVFIFICI